MKTAIFLAGNFCRPAQRQPARLWPPTPSSWIPKRFASPRPVPASDRVRFGIIGIGMQGSAAAQHAITLPGVECVAACDLYDGRHELAKEIVGNPIFPPRAAIRNCSTTRISTASSPPFPTTGTSRSWSTPSARAKTSIAKNPCRTPPPKAVDMAAAQQKDRTHRADRLAARQFRDLRQGEGD